MADRLLSFESLRIEPVGSTGVPTGARPLVDGIDLDLARGEVLGLIGESGAGKSTLGLAALGYIRPGCAVTAGRIVFDGADLGRLAPSALRTIRGARVAYVAQSAAASFNPARRLGDQVAEALMMHRAVDRAAAHRRAADLFSELDLPSPQTLGKRFPHQVSGGQLQRAMIAMAMACEPELLVLDEPTTALDVTTQIEVLAAVRKMLRRHRAAGLYITHDLAVVAQLADRLAVLRRGKLVESGATTTILQVPAEDYTRRLVAARAELDRVSDTATKEPPILVAHNIAAGYRTMTNVLTDICFTLNAAQTLAIVGMSGSGKSTLARVLCGLVPPQQGTVIFRGMPLPPDYRRRSREQLRRVQLVYQLPDTALNPRHTVGRILGRVLDFYFRLRGPGQRSRVAELLDHVGLPRDFIRRRPGELSGGQKQRVCIARALAAQPDIVICDEITSALDPLVADEILDLLLRLQQRMKTAYVFITHDIGVVRRVADEVAVLRDGKIVSLGPLAKVFSPPLHPYTHLLLSSVPQMRTDWLTDILNARGDAAR